MSTELIVRYLFPTILLPAMASVPFAVVGKGFAASKLSRKISPALLWVFTCILAWGGTAYILLVPAGAAAEWWAWYFRLAPVVGSAVPAGMLYAKRANRKWLSILPTSAAFLFLSVLLAYLISGSSVT